MTGYFAALAEFKRELIVERTGADMAAASDGFLDCRGGGNR